MKSSIIRFSALLALIVCSTLYAEPLMPSSRTQCFGRYLIDIPSNATLIGAGNKYQMVRIDYEKKSQIAWQKSIEKKKDFLKSEQGADAEKLNREIFENTKDKRLLLTRTHVFRRDIYNIYAFKYVAPYYSFSIDAVISSQYLDSSLSAAESMLNNLRFRRSTEAPKEPGFCFENGFVANDGKKPQYELVTLAFELKDHPDVHVVVESEVLFSQTDSLLQRTGKAGLLSMFDGVHTLRKGSRTVNGLTGEEVLSRYTSDQGGKAHKFRWETMGELNNPLKPDIYVDFQTGFKPGGGSVDSSLSDQEAIALFDQIVNSVRIRPTGGHDKTSDAAPDTPKAPARLPLGSKVASGRPCPEAGLWQCVHPQATPRQMTLKVGQLMPSVLVPNPRSLWQRLKGAPEELAIDSEWALVQYG